MLEIEKAAENLPPNEKQKLLLFLAARLQAEGNSLPVPRQFTLEQVSSWMAEDEADWKRIQSKQ
ncbi:MAG: hypothetical protein M3Y82_05195 [Verrucomicrobiota bacterium]|nr:hypothetical protein [Verrucomicrobiota bacterium]